MGNQKDIPLDQQDRALAHAHMYVTSVPEHIEAEGITIKSSVYKRCYAALHLTYAETLTLVKTLRQIPAIEQATAPDENVHRCRADNALS